jgi:hypothetical protein
LVSQLVWPHYYSLYVMDVVFECLVGVYHEHVEWTHVARCFIPKRLPMDLRDVMSLPYLSYHAVITHTSLLHIDCQRCSRGIVHHCV